MAWSSWALPCSRCAPARARFSPRLPAACTSHASVAGCRSKGRTRWGPRRARGSRTPPCLPARSRPPPNPSLNSLPSNPFPPLAALPPQPPPPARRARQGPLKPESAPALAALAASSHLLVMITGDAPLTACHAAAQVHIVSRPVLVLQHRWGEGADWRTARARASFGACAARVCAVFVRWLEGLELPAAAQNVNPNPSYPSPAHLIHFPIPPHPSHPPPPPQGGDPRHRGRPPPPPRQRRGGRGVRVDGPRRLKAPPVQSEVERHPADRGGARPLHRGWAVFLGGFWAVLGGFLWRF